MGTPAARGKLSFGGRGGRGFTEGLQTAAEGRRRASADGRRASADGRRWVDGAALHHAAGTGVIAFGETVVMAGGETYQLTAYQTSGEQLDFTGGELLIERLA